MKPLNDVMIDLKQKKEYDNGTKRIYKRNTSSN